jgi:hypothetical protein
MRRTAATGNEMSHILSDRAPEDGIVRPFVVPRVLCMPMADS